MAIMKIKKIKKWFKKWIISENLYRSRLHYRAAKLQKFWVDKPKVSAPLRESEYFKKIGIIPWVERRLDDYRSAATFEDKLTLPLEHCFGARNIQLGITPAKEWMPWFKVRFSLDGKETLLHDLSPEKWFDLRLDYNGQSQELTVTSDAPLITTMPRGVFNRPNNMPRQVPRHILILVLDAWTTEIDDVAHPFLDAPTSIPNIKRFFSKGFQAPNGISNGQWTLPAVASLFTGLHVGSHRMTHPRRWQEFDSGRKLLPEYFQRAGFHTLLGSVVSRVSPAFGHHRGIDRFLFHSVINGWSFQQYDPAIWMQEIITHLEVHSNDRTFSYFQFPDTHPSWDLCPDTRYFHLGRRGNTSLDLQKLLKGGRDEDFDIPSQAAQIYLLRLAELDRMLGGVFDYVERNFGDDALVVVTADHGLRMPYVDESHKDDEPFLTDVRVNIPLYIRGGGVPSIEFKELCSPNIDLPRTLLQAAGLFPDDVNFHGIDLAQDNPGRDAVISEYVYAGVYEIAVRGYGHTLYLKFRIDDINYRLLSREPYYVGLYPLNATSYASQENLVGKKNDLLEKLNNIAATHIQSIGLI